MFRCANSLDRKTISSLVWALSSRSSAWSRVCMSLCRFLALVIALWSPCLCSFLTILFRSFLKLFHTTCGLVSHLSLCILARSSILTCVSAPFAMIFFRRCSSLREVSGHVHHPLPMVGLSFGVIFTDTIEWSEGVVDGSTSHLNRCLSCLFTEYILSSLSCLYWPFLLWWCVNSLSLGLLCLHWSCMFYASLNSLSASDALLSCGLSYSGDLSIASSVILKSLRAMSGFGILQWCLSLSNWGQNST